MEIVELTVQGLPVVELNRLPREQPELAREVVFEEPPLEEDELEEDDELAVSSAACPVPPSGGGAVKERVAGSE